MIVLKYEE